MKDKIEEILYDCVMANPEEYPIKEELEKYRDKILALFKEEIKAKKDEITTECYEWIGDRRGHVELAQDIINILVGEK